MLVSGESVRDPVQVPPSFEEWLRAGALARLLRLGTALSGDPDLAQDLVQEVVIKVQRRWPTISGLERPDAYVRRMLVNEHLSFRRRFARIQLGELPDRPIEGSASDQLLDRRALVEDLRRLPVRQRTALVLRYLEDLDDGAIGELMRCRPGTVRAHVSRGLAALRAGGSPDAD